MPGTINVSLLLLTLFAGHCLAKHLVSFPRVNVRSKEGQNCGWGMFECASSKRCIPESWKCDLEADCEKGEDEEGCDVPPQCSENEYKCEEPNRLGVLDGGLRLGIHLGFIHHCIPNDWKCDGEADCINRDDERNCGGVTKCDTSRYFECLGYDPNTTQCIPNEWKCDGQTDCLDGKDEEGCDAKPKSTVCDKESEFSCRDGHQCIYASWQCDGDKDCNDGSDELNCEHATCDETSKFKCNSGFCIPLAWRCDGETDCADHSDEHGCTSTHTNHTVVCTEREFKCANGAQCISNFWLCDGDTDCYDGSDEANCSTKQEPHCDAGQRACESSPKGMPAECVAENLFCDGYEDCTDGSDEKNCTKEEVAKKRMEYQHCDNTTQYTCAGSPSRCVAYSNLCRDGSPVNDCTPSVCNQQIIRCNEGEDNCECRKTGVSGKVCNCKVGYSHEGGKCKDIDECLTPGTCDQICFNTKGSYRCDCHLGYTLTHPMRNESASKCRAVGEDPLLLLSNRAAIRQYDLTTNKYHPLITKLESAVAMDYWHKNQTLIWSDVSKEQISICHIGMNITDMTILGSLNDCLERGNVTLIDKDVVTPDGLAVDWVHGLLFWTDTGRDEINVMDLNTKHRKTLFNQDLDEPRAIAVDPTKGLIFWTDWGEKARIERSGMDGKDRVAIVTGNSSVSWPNGLALDILDQRVYWADAKTKVISSCDYDGGNVRTVLSSHRFLKHPFSLAVFEEKLYYTDWDQEGVMAVNKFGRNDDVKILMKGVTGPMTVRVYHTQAQPEHEDKCSNHSCDHLCLPRAHIDSEHNKRGEQHLRRPYSCECMDGFKVSEQVCIPMSVVIGAVAPMSEAESSKLTLTYFLLLLVVGLAFALGVMYRRQRASQFTTFHFDNPIYRRTVDLDLESDASADDAMGTVNIFPSNRQQRAPSEGGVPEGRLMMDPSVVKLGPNPGAPKQREGASIYVDVHDPDSYAYDQAAAPKQTQRS